MIGGYGWFPSPAGINGTTNPAVLKPKSVQAIFDAAFHGNATKQMAPSQRGTSRPSVCFFAKMTSRRSSSRPVACLPRPLSATSPPPSVPRSSRVGVTAWFHVKERLQVNRVHVALSAGSSGQTFLKWSRTCARLNGATLSGNAVLDAKAVGYFTVTKVEFRLTGGSQHDTLIGTGVGLTRFGWITRWNTTTVANGTYTLQSVAYDVAGRSGHSNGITITVKN